MFSSKLVLAAELLGSVPAVQASDASVYAVGSFSDAACTVPTAKSDVADEYKMRQAEGDQHCYTNKGYSIKLLCDEDDTVKVDHWFDISGKSKPCTGEPLLQDVRWELAMGFFQGECTWNAQHGAYGKLSVALPLDGYPTCDFTGASVRRLTNSSNTSSPTPSPATPAPPTPAPASAPATANNATNG